MRATSVERVRVVPEKFEGVCGAHLVGRLELDDAAWLSSSRHEVHERDRSVAVSIAAARGRFSKRRS